MITTTSSQVTSRRTSKNFTSEHLVLNGYIFIREDPNSNEILLGRIRLVQTTHVIVNLAKITAKGEDIFVCFGSEEFIYHLSTIESKSVELTQKSSIKVKHLREIKK
eukprot:TRINITY_DN3433_c0_g1_i1.p1 TRINITY_DN3433_c0_g1~~TRINITY_DN3433_c0_g1_i1.p1  ORF type:complete len:107 (+),score=9.03 TRINITY_DN3433_c0_g1_i1:104-424(+)